jgi:hypothetical protein
VTVGEEKGIESLATVVTAEVRYTWYVGYLVPTPQAAGIVHDHHLRHLYNC